MFIIILQLVVLQTFSNSLYIFLNASFTDLPLNEIFFGLMMAKDDLSLTKILFAVLVLIENEAIQPTKIQELNVLIMMLIDCFRNLNGEILVLYLYCLKTLSL